MNIKKNEKTAIDTEQLSHWKGKFGSDYIQRNLYDDWKLEYGKTAFQRMLKGIDYQSVLEVGSNIGLNLIYLSAMTDESVDLFAVEPNHEAYKTLCANEAIRLKKAFNNSAFEIPIADESMDLVFTKGVLIHISPKELKRSTDEIVRVAKRYILCAEYFSHTPEMIEYRGESNLLFKRDFGAFYLDAYPQLSCISYGFLWQHELKVFDNLNWWLFEK